MQRRILLIWKDFIFHSILDNLSISRDFFFNLSYIYLDLLSLFNACGIKMVKITIGLWDSAEQFLIEWGLSSLGKGIQNFSITLIG